jgi:two-component system OmpR family sensor kinase
VTGASWIKGLALGSVFIFIGLTGYTLSSMQALQADLTEDLGENMVWAASQATYQSSLLQQAHLAPGALPGHRGNPVLQRALLRGRLEVLLAPSQTSFMIQAGVLEQLQQVKAIAHSQEPDFVRIQTMLHDIGRQIMLTEREQSGERRDAYKRLLRQLIFFLYCVMASGGVLCWQLLRSLRSTRDALGEVARQHAQARELVDALEQERAARERYRNFVSVMSHQLRTPLAVIDSSAQRLMRQDNSVELEPNITARSQRIRRSVRQLNQLITRVLQGLRLDEQNDRSTQLEIMRCDWLDVVRQALDSFGDLLAARRVNLHSALDSLEQPLWIECDRLWCAEILANLISNADKYSPPESDIDIHIDSAYGMLRCQVINSGPSIPEEDLERLFERFFRGSNGHRASGVGIGLSIARTLAQWHRGSLTASNTEVGVCFTLLLPLQAQH